MLPGFLGALNLFANMLYEGWYSRRGEEETPPAFMCWVCIPKLAFYLIRTCVFNSATAGSCSGRSAYSYLKGISGFALGIGVFVLFLLDGSLPHMLLGLEYASGKGGVASEPAGATSPGSCFVGCFFCCLSLGFITFLLLP